jgi:diacylglycerol kinase (ATP)
VEINHIFFIVNPFAGKDEPVVQTIHEIFNGSDQKITIHEMKDGEDPAEIARRALSTASMIAIYGGDGSATGVASALINTNMPLAIIPGGTANVLSKELCIPQDTEDALTFIRDGKYRLKVIDTGTVNDRPFLLRINLGIMSDMITETDPGLKDKIGQMAYGVTTVKTLANAEPVSYQLNIDGEVTEAKGVSLSVTNSGHMGIGDFQLQPGISVSDGLLDVILMKDAGILSIIKAAGGALFGTETDAVSHWTCKQVTVTLPNEQTYLCDDCEVKAKELTIKIVPASLTMVVPLSD